MNKKQTPFIATHPGELIKDELKARNMTQKQLSELTGIKPSVLSETINGKRSVSLAVAMALEKALDVPAEIWMNLQTQKRYRLPFHSAIDGCFRKSPESLAGLVPFNLLKTRKL